MSTEPGPIGPTGSGAESGGTDAHPELEQQLEAAAAAFRPTQSIARLHAATVAAERRAWRRGVLTIGIAATVFVLGVAGLGLGVSLRRDQGDNAHLVASAPGTSVALQPSGSDALKPLTIAVVPFPSLLPVPPTTTTVVTSSSAPTTATTTDRAASLGLAGGRGGSGSTATTSPVTVGSRRPATAPVTAAPTLPPVPATPAPTIGPPATPPPTTQPPVTIPPTTPAPPPPPTIAPPPPPPAVPLTAHWRTRSSATPFLSAIFGTAQPGSTVTITAPQGQWSATADSRGNWGRYILFAGVIGAPPVSVSSPQGTIGVACGS